MSTLNNRINELQEELNELKEELNDRNLSGGKTYAETGPFAAEGGELAGAAELSGGGLRYDNETSVKREWNWEVPGGTVNITYNGENIDIPELSDFTYMIDDFIDETLELFEDTITDIRRYRRKNG